MATISAEEIDEFQKKRFRSPPYPAFPLSKAIDRAREVYEKAFQHKVPAQVLAGAWGMSATSSSIMTAVAALKQFGLLNDEGSGDKRRFSLSDDAVRIVTDPVPSSPKRIEAIRRSALAPKVHAELWQRYGLAGMSGSLDAAMQSYLTLDRKDAGEAPYSMSAAVDVIDIFKDTVRFAGLADAEATKEADERSLLRKQSGDEPPGRHQVSVKVGEYVQWENNGALIFDRPKRVRAVQTSDGREWVFVEGSETGIPMAEALVQEPPAASSAFQQSPTLALEPEQPHANMRKEIITLDEGDAILTFPDTLSPASYEDLAAHLELFLRKMKRRAIQTKDSIRD